GLAEGELVGRAGVVVGLALDAGRRRRGQLGGQLVRRRRRGAGVERVRVRRVVVGLALGRAIGGDVAALVDQLDGGAGVLVAVQALAFGRDRAALALATGEQHREERDRARHATFRRSVIVARSSACEATCPSTLHS